MTNTHLTIENVERIAQRIADTQGIGLEEARDLAEFNLRYSPISTINWYSRTRSTESSVAAEVI